MVSEDETLVLVHGTAVGQGPIEGQHHAHAWCERTDRVEWPDGAVHELVTCIDHSNGHEIEMPAAVYYRIGRVHDVRRYEHDDAISTALRHGHYGPWWEEPAADE